ncbi:HNH endonuclease [Deinococcus hohokamensis]|uniref:HNH endonuclease n=1 Tax=Deinococcus hohokamensis TaxID=309883 RepID=A0ABV9I587_9DEIO
MAQIPLHGKRGKGKVALCDDADLPLLSGHRWHLCHHGYARTNLRRADGRSSTIEMHLLLRDKDGGTFKDHKNGDKLDNRRQNLRPCTQAENSRNRRMHRNNKSGFKGVSRHKKGWRAVIHLPGRQVYLGVYPHPLLAALAYNAAAVALFGAFARVNELPGLNALLTGEVAHAAD